MFGEGACIAIGLASGADPSTVPDQRVADEGPFLAGDDLDEVSLDLDGVLAVFAGPGQG